ncbi:hypothetical protein NQ317_013183 [Molorchus minor]|uniref:Tyr recombinase domain-containing protein n=1 Tax=Molorchus minor TaxID=1323400 RepID=A0ABQ9J6S3_9CUCU|nr:hypothetical protein NQ317_013183 [Molorchus minor]
METQEEPQDIVEAAGAAVLNLLPTKSRNLYDKAYNQFREWCKRKKVQRYTENVMLAYLHEKSNEYKSSTIALIFGISGACRGDELTNLRVDDIEDVVSSLIITIPNTKTKISRTFVITRTEGNTNLLDLYRKYAALRPPHTSHGLSDPALYTGHCLRRSLATVFQKEVKFWRGAMFVLIVLQRFMEKTTRINDIYQDYCVILLRDPHILNS